MMTLKINHLLALALALGAAACGGVEPSDRAVSEDDLRAQVTTSVNVRSGPGTSAGTSGSDSFVASSSDDVDDFRAACPCGFTVTGRGIVTCNGCSASNTLTAEPRLEEISYCCDECPGGVGEECNVANPADHDVCVAGGKCFIDCPCGSVSTDGTTTCTPCGAS